MMYRWQGTEPTPLNLCCLAESKWSMSKYSCWPLLVLLAPACGSQISTSTDAPVDSGVADAAPDAAPSANRLSVDFAAAAYPALTHKLGLNSNWNKADADDLAAAARASQFGAPMVAGLIETSLGPGDAGGNTEAVNYPENLFYRDPGGVLRTRTSEPLRQLRSRVRDGHMLNYVQLAGTPCSTNVADCLVNPDLFTIDPTARNTSGGEGDGNWYPLPVAAQVPALAALFADFAQTLTADGGPTIWGLWQEPDHTIAENLTKPASVQAYLALYRPFANALRMANPDAMIAGPQQNQATGTNGDHRIDGAGYNSFVRNNGVGVGQGSAVPLDYITIQNYLGKESTLETVQNTRIAYDDARFNTTTVMFNEWDINKSKVNGFDNNYNTPAGLISVLTQLKQIYDLPDVSYALLMRELFTASHETLVLPVLRQLDAMSAMRRPVVIAGTDQASLQGIAAGDAQNAVVLLWNRDTVAHKIDVELRALASALVAGSAQLVVEQVTTAATPTLLQTLDVTAATLNVAALTVPAQGLLLIRIGDRAPATNGLRAAQYARHFQWCDRLGRPAYDAPHGMGQYEVRDGSLVASVDGSAGVGMSAVVLRAVPSSYALQIVTKTAGLPASSSTAAVALRVDYLKADNSLQTVIYRDPRFTGALPAATFVTGTAPAPVMRELMLADDGTVTVPITADAPEAWGASRRLLVSLIVAGVAQPATVVAQLADAP